jgi:branched-chain amino acid transport system permease protein
MHLSNYQRGMVLAIGGLILVFLPFIIRSPYWVHMFILIGLESIVVMGFIAQYKVRLITFCSATFWGLGAYISGFLSKSWGVNFWLCLPLSGMGTAFIAFILGLVVVRAGWVTFLMISIVIAQVFVEVLGHIPVLGGWDGITDIPRPTIGSFVFFSKTSYYYLTLGLVVLCGLIFHALYRSAIGRAWTAIGQSSDLAASVGINTFRYRMTAYVAAGSTAGLSGCLYAHYSSYLVPNTFDMLRSLYIPISAVVGGIKFVIAGPITGSVIMKALPELLRTADKYEPIFLGAMIILCVFFFRQGILEVLLKRSTHRP